jgi:transposase
MLTAGGRFPDRVWAVEGCAGIGRHVAQRLVTDGETVVDVPAKLSARVRVFDTGQGRKTDPVDAHSVAVAGLRSPSLRTVVADDATVALRLLLDRRDELGRARTETSSRIHHLLLELIPGAAKKFLTRGQASYLLRTAPAPVGIAAQTRHHLARELIEELHPHRHEDPGRGQAVAPARGRSCQHPHQPQRDRPIRGGPAAG